MIWFIADEHYGHQGIISYCERPFSTTKEMEHTLISNHNQVVQNDDIVYHLGDLSMDSREDDRALRKIIKQLNGQHHLILGNHDKMTPFQYIDMGFTSVHTSLLLQDKYILNHDPCIRCSNTKYTFLCGHVHNLFRQYKNVINVGVDVWNFTPISLTDIEILLGDYK